MQYKLLILLLLAYCKTPFQPPSFALRNNAKKNDSHLTPLGLIFLKYCFIVMAQ